MKIKTFILIISLILTVIALLFIDALHNDIKRNRERISELEYKVECLERDAISFENMHADHYGFEEDEILNLIEPTKAKAYKAKLDSLRNLYKNHD